MTAEILNWPICGGDFSHWPRKGRCKEAVMCDFIPNVIDEGNAAEVLVNGVSRICRISPNQMMISYYKRRDGVCVKVLDVVWDREEWMKQWNAWDAHREVIVEESFTSSDGLCREMH